MTPMAPQRTPEQYDEVAAFVRELYAQSGCPSWAAFARRAGVSSMDVSNWQLGKVIPDGWHLYCLIRAAGGAPPMRSFEDIVRVAEGRILAGLEDLLEAHRPTLEAEVEQARAQPKRRRAS